MLFLFALLQNKPYYTIEPKRKTQNNDSSSNYTFSNNDLVQGSKLYNS